MAATAQDVIDTLKSIDASLKALVVHFGCGLKAAAPANTPARIASDAELDGPRGNPSIRAKSPRDWTGEDQLGKPYSECPPEYLDLLAERFDWFNESETDVKKRGYNSNDASRARGWAARIRNGYKPVAQEPTAFPSDSAMPDEDSIPF